MYVLLQALTHDNLEVLALSSVYVRVACMVHASTTVFLLLVTWMTVQFVFFFIY
jgi:hypothetical protein